MQNYQSFGTVCCINKYNLVYALCDIEYNLSSDNTYSYTFRPNYSILDLVDKKFINEIVGSKLGKTEYILKNDIPPFILDKLDKNIVYNNYDKTVVDNIDPISSLTRNDNHFINDLFVIKRHQKKKIIFDDYVGKENNNAMIKEILSNICIGNDVVIGKMLVDDNNRMLIHNILLDLYSRSFNNQKELQRDGINKAKEKGLYRGRKPKEFDEIQFRKIVMLVDLKKMTARDAAEMLGMSIDKYYREKKKLALQETNVRTDNMAKYTKEDIKRICEEENIKYIRLQFTDMLGTLKNVEIPISGLDDALNNNVMFDGSSIEGFVRTMEADMFLVPDLNTFLISSWEDTTYGKVAQFICDVYRPNEKGEKVPFDGDPRTILKRNLEELHKLGYKDFNLGLEPEFFLFKLDKVTGEPTLNYNDNGGYFDVAPIDAAEDCRRDIVLELQKIGFVVEAAHHEVSPGQHEIDFKFDNALEACDNVQTFKLIVKNIARRHGLHATFTPKPVKGINGSGMHCNCSLTDNTGKNIFNDPTKENGLSDICLKWIDGILAHAKGFCFVTNPLVNSYKRIVPGYEAPCYISWSASNRSTMIRIPASRGNATRTEVRSVDPACNPYLAASVLLAAGLDGIKGNCKSVPELHTNLFALDDEERKQMKVESLPENLKEAVIEFKNDKIMQKAIGEHATTKLIQAKKLEWDEFRTTVTEWEIKKYINRY